MLAAWVGMISNMAVAFIDLLFLSYLDNLQILAAMGFAGSILFITGSLGIGFSVATGVLVSQSMAGEGRQAAARWLSAIMMLAFVAGVIICVPLLIALPFLLAKLGASADVSLLAQDYLHIVLITTPVSVVSMTLAASLRATAAAKASMVASLVVAFVNLVLDPILIFGFGMGLEGAAWATAIARVAGLAMALQLVAKQGLLTNISPSEAFAKLKPVNKIAVPAVLTNLFTPIGGLIVVQQLAPFGDAAVAGQALVASISPMLFAVYFALSGAAGPMIGQNVGAGQPERIQLVLTTGVKVILGYTLLMWLLFALLCPLLINLYQVEGLAAEMIRAFCYWQVPMFAGLGLLALANSVFNNLGRPYLSTWFNGSRATIGTLLFCMLGASSNGAVGVVIGSSLAMTVFGAAATVAAAMLFYRRYPQVKAHGRA